MGLYFVYAQSLSDYSPNVMVLIHEFGHYARAKALGFRINEFSVGFGPTLLQRSGNAASCSRCVPCLSADIARSTPRG